jgi:tetratricopeptide (TPR) repeat protein
MWRFLSERLGIHLCIAVIVAALSSGTTVATETELGDSSHGNLALLTEYGVTLALAGDVAGAERAFMDLLARSPGDARALNNLGNLHLLGGEPVLALAFYARASAVDSVDVGIRLNRSIALMQGGDEEAALQEATLAVREAGSLEGAAALLGLRSGEPILKATKPAADPTLTRSQITALLKDAAQAVPRVDESKVPAGPTPVVEESGPRDTKERTWRAAGARATDQSDAHLNLYWKLE